MIEAALRMAARSNCNYQHGAVIAKAGRPLFKGINRDKTHPRWGVGYKNKIHAELDAIRQAHYEGCPERLYGATIYIARGDGGISKPCRWCQKWIAKYRMRVVHT